MEFNGIVQSLENKVIFITGSTGYLSKSLIYAVFVEKILRVHPNVTHLFLLLRPADAVYPTLRLHKDGRNCLVLRDKHGLGFDSFISDKVTPISGDVSFENMGIKDPDLEKKLHEEINFVAHFAAATTFEERSLDPLVIIVGRRKLPCFIGDHVGVWMSNGFSRLHPGPIRNSVGSQKFHPCPTH
ncbi:fatty acyl-CoA reductase 8-like [Papaver somniferum]|uniref:fatty acyl-CoA reductase 8-like n=1 Tax=Papaver somniferum TaxID=3469 RepID=UPI000E6F79A9|nr:fatty acyl-CoA reductase 8-like [Papaver somniferum]